MKRTVTVTITEEECNAVLIAIKQYRRLTGHTTPLSRLLVNVVEYLERAPVEYEENVAGTKLEGTGV